MERSPRKFACKTLATITMDKTILLGATSVISNRASKWLWSIIGTLYIGLGTSKIYNQGASFESVGWLIIGASFLIYGLIIFSATLLTPQIRITDSEIQIKKKILDKATLVPWTHILSIEFGPYLISLQLNDRVETISYSSHAEASIEIKSIIREVAESKDIPVTGG